MDQRCVQRVCGFAGDALDWMSEKRKELEVVELDGLLRGVDEARLRELRMLYNMCPVVKMRYRIDRMFNDKFVDDLNVNLF